METTPGAIAKSYRCLIWYACAISALAVVQGCATRPQSLDQAPKLGNQSELLERLGLPLLVEQKGECQVWHYRHRYLNLFTLTSTIWLAEYSIDAGGKVCNVDIQESISSRRLWRRTKLPEDFQEFR